MPDGAGRNKNPPNQENRLPDIIGFKSIIDIFSNELNNRIYPTAIQIQPKNNKLCFYYL